MTSEGMPEELILDYSTWRCGGPEMRMNKPNLNALGRGSTSLHNYLGFECCLGQFVKQIDPSITDVNIQGRPMPDSLKVIVPGLSFLKIVAYDGSTKAHKNTDLALEAAKINDNYFTAPEEKIDRLTSLFNNYGVQIKVINKPETI